MRLHKKNKMFEGEQPAQQQPAQQPQQQNQVQPQQNQILNQENIGQFKKTVMDAINKTIQDSMNSGNSVVGNFLKSNQEAHQFISNVIAKNDDIAAKLDLMTKFFNTLDKTVSQPVQQQAQQPAQQQQQPQQPAQQNESSFISKYQKKLFENHCKNKLK